MKILRALLLLALISASAAPAVSFASEDGFTAPKQETVFLSNALAKVTQENTNFANGDFFWIRRYEFLKTSPQPYVSSFTIPGDSISIRYAYTQNGTQKFADTSELRNIPKSTLFISTDKYHFIIGVPGVYLKQSSYETMTVASDKESPVTIVKGDGFYTVRMKFPQNDKYIGEIWALQSQNILVEWDARAETQFAVQDLANGKRLSFEGYYFETLGGYKPGGANVLFRHPSCYVGGALSRTPITNAERDLGYVLMKRSAANQNKYGYWETPCESSWLKADFNIGAGFYDTRFNTDFAVNLLDAYAAHGDPEFLERAESYAAFYMDFAKNNSYVTGKGILVQDYWYPEKHIPTHVSLNHHLAELNFLISLYGVTQNEDYLALAEKMLSGVEETREKWVLSSGNLAYGLYYTGKTITLVDYPYLTYNDLHATRRLLKNVLGRTNDTIQYLMDSKLKWMTRNGVTGYLK